MAKLLPRAQYQPQGDQSHLQQARPHILHEDQMQERLRPTKVSVFDHNFSISVKALTSPLQYQHFVLFSLQLQSLWPGQEAFDFDTPLIFDSLLSINNSVHNLVNPHHRWWFSSKSRQIQHDSIFCQQQPHLHSLTKSRDSVFARTTSRKRKREEERRNVFCEEHGHESFLVDVASPSVRNNHSSVVQQEWVSRIRRWHRKPRKKWGCPI